MTAAAVGSVGPGGCPVRRRGPFPRDAPAIAVDHVRGCSEPTADTLRRYHEAPAAIAERVESW